MYYWYTLDTVDLENPSCLMISEIEWPMRRANTIRPRLKTSESGSLPIPGIQTTNSEQPHDKAHFWLNSYINKRNCRIWSEANPQVYVETPLHPEKLTVWCALWAGGILLQKR
ncbi:hypothetical protein TNCV_3281421 [Trichonephila clavipes]|nr:hypothetical protein TNCV_3281421 [Trichonephila clavipes]